MNEQNQKNPTNVTKTVAGPNRRARRARQQQRQRIERHLKRRLGQDLVIFYTSDYVVEGNSFETSEKSGRVAESLEKRPVTGVVVVEPEPATVEELAPVHSAEYIQAVATGEPRTLAGSNGLGWWPGLFRAVSASTGGVIDAVLFAYRNRVHAGSLSSGLHHASADRGAGFCTFNGIAVAAKAARADGARRVLIVDFDAHCGGGTASIIEGVEGIEQVDVSVVEYDGYRSRPDARLEFADAEDYLEVCESILAGIESPETVDVVIYNAGMDPHEDAGGVGGITAEVLAERERLVFDWAERHGLPVAFVLAGGYLQGADWTELVNLHRLTIRKAAAVMQARPAAA